MSDAQSTDYDALVCPDDGHLLACTINFDDTWTCDPTCPIPPEKTGR